MSLVIRKATPEDASLLLRIVDMASDGIVPALWAETAPEGADGAAIGHALVAAEDGEFSYRNGLVAERDGAKVGGLIGHRLPMRPQPIAPDLPEAFVGIEEMTRLVPGYWYINFMAVLPENQGQGLGTALLKEAERQARHSASPALALIVVASNERAIRVYQRAGYVERERCPFDLSELGVKATEAVLMTKDLA